VLEGSVSHDKFTRLLSNGNFDSGITTLYKKRWRVEQYHKEVKQITSFGKSPTKTVKTQSNHFYLSIMAYSKMEILKIRTKSNAFSMKDRLYYSALKHAMEQIKELSTNQIKNAD